MSFEKRTYPGFEISQFVEMDFGHEIYISAEVINLSRNGVLCKTEEECPLYSSVYMMMTLTYKNKKRIINLEGVVSKSVHKRNGWETGVNVTSMSKASRTVFDEVMNHLHS